MQSREFALDDMQLTTCDEDDAGGGKQKNHVLIIMKCIEGSSDLPLIQDSVLQKL